MVRKCSDVRLRSKGKKKTAKRRKNREKILGLRDIKNNNNECLIIAAMGDFSNK